MDVSSLALLTCPYAVQGSQLSGYRLLLSDWSENHPALLTSRIQSESQRQTSQDLLDQSAGQLVPFMMNWFTSNIALSAETYSYCYNVKYIYLWLQLILNVSLFCFEFFCVGHYITKVEKGPKLIRLSCVLYKTVKAIQIQVIYAQKRNLSGKDHVKFGVYLSRGLKDIIKNVRVGLAKFPRFFIQDDIKV